MNFGIDIALYCVVLMNVLLVSSSRISTCIKIVALEGIVIGFMPLIIKFRLDPQTCFFVVAMVTLKGFIFPMLLNRNLRELNVRKEVEPMVSYPVSVAIFIFVFMISIWLSSKIEMPQIMSSFSKLVLPVSFSTIICGFFIIISRLKALNQVLGYLVIENGISIFGIVLLLEQPLLVELAILLDIFVAVFVMGIAVFHINREFDDIDTQELSQLKR